MHILLMQAHTVPSEDAVTHIGIEELTRIRIPALRGRHESNNRFVLETLALHGPLIKYDIFKLLKPEGVKHYPTISRRVDDLKKKGYIGASGKRVINVGRRVDKSPTYSLTWRGFVATLSIETVARKAPTVLQNNPLLKIPFPKKLVVRALDELFSPREIEAIVNALLEGFLRAIPRDVESIEQEKYIAYLVPAMVETPEIRERFERKNLTKLYQIPGFLDYVLNLISNAEKQLTDALEGVQAIKKELNTHIQETKKQKMKANKLPRPIEKTMCQERE